MLIEGYKDLRRSQLVRALSQIVSQVIYGKKTSRVDIFRLMENPLGRHGVCSTEAPTLPILI